MTEIIQAHLRRVRRRIRLRLFLIGLFLVGSVFVCGSALAILLDWALELSRGVRTLLAAFVLGSTAYVAWRYLVRPALTRLSDVWLARQIERYYPSLKHELAGAVEFLREEGDETVAGSAELRAAVVRKVSEQLRAVESGVILRQGPYRFATLAATVSVGIALAALVLGGDLVAIGVARLYAPFGSARWPYQTVLTFRDLKTRVARGDPYEVHVEVVSGRVPDRAVVHLEFEDGTVAVQPLRPVGRRAFAGGVESVLAPFNVWVEAGNARTGSAHVDVVPPPDVAELHGEVRFPKYTRTPPKGLPEGVGNVRAVWGSEVRLTAKFTKPLSQALLRFEGGRTVQMALSEDGLGASVNFRIDRDTSYWLELKDREGLRNRNVVRFQIRALEDRAPEVFLVEPQGTSYVTPKAVLTVRGSAKDDFGVGRVWLSHWMGEEKEPEASKQIELLRVDPPEERVEFEHRWSLEPLKLELGQVVSFYVAASDMDNLRGPNVGKSRVYRLFVVTPEELLDRLVDRQRVIQEELERVLRQEEHTRQDVADALEEARQGANVEEEDLGQIRSAELSQQQVRRLLTRSSGVRDLAQQTLKALEDNALEQDELAERLRELITALDLLDRGALAEAERQLLVARRAAEEAARRRRPLGERGTEALQRAEAAQQQVISDLARMLDEFGRYENLRAIARDAERLAQQQEQLAQQSRDVGARTVGRRPEDLPPDLRAELGKLAGRQENARAALRQLQERMKALSERLAQEDPVAAEMLRQAAENSERAGTEDLMRQASQALRDNRVGEAQQRQEQAAQDLRNLLETLQQSGTPNLEQLVKQLRELEKKLEEVRRRQLQQLQRTRRAANEQDEARRRRELQELARQQRELERELSRLAQQMARLNARNASRRASSAAGRMGRAAQSMQQDQANQAEQEQEQVLEDLQQAQQELERARREAEALLAMEQLRRIESQIVHLHDRQVAAAEETARIRTKRQERNGRWSRPLLASVARARREQDRIRKETELLIDALDAAPVYVLVLRNAISLMDSALRRLGQRDVGQETERAQREAAAQFARLLEALKPEEGEAEGGNQQGGGGQGGGQGGSANGLMQLVAQLRLLKMLQTDIKQQTEQIEATRARTGQLTPEQQQRLEELERLQGELADIVRQLTPEAPDNGAMEQDDGQEN